MNKDLRKAIGTVNCILHSSTFLAIFSFSLLSKIRRWQPTPVFLPGKSHAS